MKKITVIGDGGWGTALAMVLAQNKHDVTVWGPFPEYIETIKKTGENQTFLPEIKLPKNINWTADRETAAKDNDLIVMAVPTRFYSSVLDSFKNIIPASCPILSVSKGFDQETQRRMTQIAEDILGPRSIAVLSGPSHAEEVARKIPTTVVTASTDQALCVEIQNMFTNNYFRTYSSDDVPGVELGGALKNIIAIAVGVSDGIGFGDNTRAALITRGLVEITRLGCACGAKPLTFSGLSGLGDLIVTCTSQLSRNRSFGEKLGQGKTTEEILSETKQAVEGYWNCTIARDMAEKAGIEVPITSEVCAIIHENKKPQDAVASLMERDVKPEQ